MKYLFLDESGDHNLNNIDLNYPLFVLAGCIIDQAYYDKSVIGKINGFKQEFFQDEKVILHYVDYTRNKGAFEKVKEKEFREKFYENLNNVISDVDFTLLACVINKQKHNKKYGILAADPYLFSVEIIVERFVKYLESVGDKGCIVAESRGNQLDNELELSFLNLKIKGTKFVRPVEISKNITSFNVRKKEENINGLQLVDAMVTPIGRRYLERKNFYINYDVIKEKFRKSSCGKYLGYGLVMLPK